MPRLASLVIEGQQLDQVMVLDRPERAQLEIHLHGSELLLAELVRHLEIDPLQLSAAESLLTLAMDEAQIQLALEQLAQPWVGFLAGLDDLPREERGPVEAAARERSRIAMAMARPTRLVICGAQNAGKSTLMNRLLASARSLTGAEAGLTRDP
ncbi:MAG: GTPase, partial [Planctomycetota bacterium]